MDLATAGMISGAGNNASQALNTAQTGMIASQLQAERDKMETARLQLHEQYATDRENRGYAHAETLQAGNQAFEAGRDQTRLGGDIATKGMEIGARKEEHAADSKLKNRALDISQQEANDKGSYYRSLAKAAGEKVAAIHEKKLDPATKVRVDYLMKRLDGINDFMKSNPMATPEDQSMAKDEIESIGAAIDQLVGAETIEPQTAKSRPVKDRFAGTIKPNVPNSVPGSEVAKGGR